MAAAGPTTYREFFGVAANDPHAGDPTQIIQAQAPGAQAQPADLRAIVGTDPNPDPYLFVAANGRVHVVLRIHLVPPSFGQNQSRYAGQLVGQLDDVTELGNTLVSFPNDAFHLVSQGAQLNVFSLAELEAGLAGMGDEDLFDPPNAGDPHVEQVQVRFFTYVSYRYASLIIGLDGCTPAVAYHTKPLPIDLFILAADATRAIPTPKCQALANMIYIAFFFLMRPGEHCDSGPDSHPFHTV